MRKATVILGGLLVLATVATAYVSIEFPDDHGEPESLLESEYYVKLVNPPADLTYVTGDTIYFKSWMPSCPEPVSGLVQTTTNTQIATAYIEGPETSAMIYQRECYGKARVNPELVESYITTGDLVESGGRIIIPEWLEAGDYVICVERWNGGDVEYCTETFTLE